MSLVLVAVFRADRQRVDYSQVEPLDVAMNFIATFQPAPGVQVNVSRVAMVHALDWAPGASINKAANQVTFQIEYGAMVLAAIFSWSQLIDEINRLYGAPLKLE